MKNKNYGILILLSVFWLLPELVNAQSDLQISKVFEKYGSRKHVVMVEMSREMLASYNMTLYKSISIKEDPSSVEFVRNCLSKDKEGAKKIKQVMKGGELVSAYYQLNKRGKDNRFILFRSDPPNVVTLIYIETEEETDNIVNMLLKKK
ncbi:DUF6108 family protein [Parabacteroides sp. FAFU027]|uniref:DUF6108 family protein n=1 Tax=Parabacteroides sp. FAFU027 TaxID=2922715 RepID=UPI001FAECEB7|nr:DUF6108 family protein [Parabacteroides sp. FAFU027]